MPSPGTGAMDHARAVDRVPPTADRIEAGRTDASTAACGGSRVLVTEPVKRGAGTPCGTGCEQVSFGYSLGYGYEVSGNLAVYSGFADNFYHVVQVELEKRAEARVRKGTDGVGCIWVDTNGMRLAYTCGAEKILGGRVTTLQTYDPATHVETDLECLPLIAGKGTAPQFVALSSAGVAAQISFDAEPATDISLHRFSSGKLDNLSGQHGAVWESNADGPLIVWTQVFKDTTGMTIVLHDTRDGTSRALDPTQNGPQWKPRMEGEKIVWVDHRNGPGDAWQPRNGDIYLHDLSTGKTTPVTTHPARQDNPDVHGDWVVWEDYRHGTDPNTIGQGQIDLYGKNLKTGVEVRLTDLKTMPVQWPRVDSNRVFFVGAGHLYMIDLAKR